MEDKEKFSVRREWIEQAIDILTPEEMEEYCYGIIMYGLYGKKIEPRNKSVRLPLNLIYPNLDRIANYGQQFNKGGGNVGNGRPAKYDPAEVWKLARELKSVKAVAAALEEKYGGTVNVKGLYSNKGWLARKDDNFLGENDNSGFNF